METTTATAAHAPTPTTAPHRTRLHAPRRLRRIAVATAAFTALAIPVTGVGSALATTHPPTRAVAVAAVPAYALVPAAGKRDV